MHKSLFPRIMESSGVPLYIGIHFAILKHCGYMPVFKDSLKSIVRWVDIIFAIDFSDFVSRLSVPGPLVLSN